MAFRNTSSPTIVPNSRHEYGKPSWRSWGYTVNLTSGVLASVLQAGGEDGPGAGEFPESLPGPADSLPVCFGLSASPGAVDPKPDRSPCSGQVVQERRKGLEQRTREAPVHHPLSEGADGSPQQPVVPGPLSEAVHHDTLLHPYTFLHLPPMPFRILLEFRHCGNLFFYLFIENSKHNIPTVKPLNNYIVPVIQQIPIERDTQKLPGSMPCSRAC
uniref:uncharacterized protein LOC123991077 n=1 Tax=Oncorhynchus gorbuscha TaxID=8017 RepID=UPI001EAEA1A3|nr:uncharacterized protein LOC123991077 [Oncorhynchus gorbuscha]